MTIRAIAAIALTVLVVAAAAKAEGVLPQEAAMGETDATQAATNADERLLIVNGNTGHVIYDDGQDDSFCVTRKVVVGYDDWGFPIRKQAMYCH
jgi:hypothetical protein